MRGSLVLRLCKPILLVSMGKFCHYLLCPRPSVSQELEREHDKAVAGPLWPRRGAWLFLIPTQQYWPVRCWGDGPSVALWDLSPATTLDLSVALKAFPLPDAPRLQQERTPQGRADTPADIIHTSLWRISEHDSEEACLQRAM